MNDLPHVYESVDISIDGDGRLPSGQLTMQIKEFQDSGLLMEINRMFLHPLGLSMALAYPGDETDRESVREGRVVEMMILDNRLDDPEGWMFANIAEEDVERLNKIHVEFSRRCYLRKQKLGYAIQPVEVYDGG